MGLANWLGNLLSGGKAPDPGPPDPGPVGWLPDAENRWGVPVLDVRPVTHHMLSATKDPKVAATFGSMGTEDGTAFAREEPVVARRVEAAFRYRIEGRLWPGVVFRPEVMEHKWAIYFHESRLIFVRTWQRRVFVVAEARQDGDHALVGPARGSFSNSEEEPPSFTARLLDWFIRSHALGMLWPAPLPPGSEAEPRSAALWCMTALGNLAAIATSHEVRGEVPERPLRVDSLLHLAAGQGNLARVDALLAAGFGPDSRARGGLTPAHWAVDAKTLALLLDRGAPIEAPSDDGTSLLMAAAQRRSYECFTVLLERGADPNAADARGFTALHRAAEMGELDLVRRLLDRGAARSPRAQGHTPRSLAEQRGHAKIVELLGSAG